MPPFATLQEYQSGEAQQPPSPPNPDIGSAGSAHYRRTLWLHAKKHFYHRDDHSKAASLCKQLIERFALTEEADDAKLLLHDIRIEIRKLVGTPDGKMPVGYRTRTDLQKQLSVPAAGDRVSGTRLPIAAAVVGLPILGIARGDIIGIGVPELLVFAFLQGSIWTGSKLRYLVHRLMDPA